MPFKPRLLALIIGMAVVAITLVMLASKFGHPDRSRTRPAEAPSPAFIRTGDRFFIPAASPLRKRLVIQPVEPRDAPHALTFPAAVEALPTETTNILPPLAGKILELKVGLGDRVARGQLLAVLASADLAQAYSDYDKARDARDLAAKALDRARGVTEAGGSAVKDLESAQSAYAQARAEFERTETALKVRGGAPGLAGAARQVRITAPVSGVVTALSSSAGAYVNDPTASMMTIANLDTVWVTANAPEDAVGAIVRGQRVDITMPAYPGQVFHGRVTIAGDVLEPDTRREKIRIALANPDKRLKPNMFANATVLVPQPPQVFVPQSALVMNNDSTTVFVEVAPWTFARTKVDLGDDDGDSTRVLQGIAPGARVVVKGAVLLND